MAQTDGKPLPDLRPVELGGTAPPQLIVGLTAALTADGYTVERGPCGAANGYTDFRSRTVRVRDDVADAQAAKTLTHELAHVRADHEHRFLATYATSAGCRAQAEVEAESIAYVVTTAAGMATESYSVPYVAGWAGGDADLLRAAATRVLTIARGIVEDLGLIPPEVTETAALQRSAGADRTAPSHDPASR